jgi:hypothetical protein
MTSSRPLRPTLLFVFLALLWPGAASAQLAEWDQERVTKLAAELKDRTAKLYDVFYKQPPATIGSGEANSYYKLKQLVRRIKREANHLASELEKGSGRTETQTVYENLMEMVRDGTEEARRTFTSEDLVDAATSAGSTLRLISPYYDPNALRNPVREAEEAGAGATPATD